MTKVRRENVNPKDTTVSHLNPDQIVQNPQNPRLIFNQTSLDELLQSISEVGIQVPITVFRSKDTGKFVILDGERRWRCAQKLNLPSIPALVRTEPSAIENILIMFNIHKVREDWALLPTALKLRDIKELVAAERDGKAPSDNEVAAMTGVAPAQVKRAFELLDLPQKDLDRLMAELDKPKREQTITEDFYIEAMRAAKTIQKYQPAVAEKHKPAEIVDILVDKYDSKVITNLVELRDVSKLARADAKSGADTGVVITSLNRLLDNPSTKISDAYSMAAASSYYKRDLTRKISDLSEEISAAQKRGEIDKDVKLDLKKLLEVIKMAIEGN